MVGHFGTRCRGSRRSGVVPRPVATRAAAAVCFLVALQAASSACRLDEVSIAGTARPQPELQALTHVFHRCVHHSLLQAQALTRVRPWGCTARWQGTHTRRDDAAQAIRHRRDGAPPSITHNSMCLRHSTTKERRARPHRTEEQHRIRPAVRAASALLAARRRAGPAHVRRHLPGAVPRSDHARREFFG